jgi:hypothetical protein
MRICAPSAPVHTWSLVTKKTFSSVLIFAGQYITKATDVTRARECARTRGQAESADDLLSRLRPSSAGFCLLSPELSYDLSRISSFGCFFSLPFSSYDSFWFLLALLFLCSPFDFFLRFLPSVYPILVLPMTSNDPFRQPCLSCPKAASLQRCAS